MNGFVGRAALATLALALFAACAQEGTPTLALLCQAPSRTRSSRSLRPSRRRSPASRWTWSPSPTTSTRTRSPTASLAGTGPTSSSSRRNGPARGRTPRSSRRSTGWSMGTRSEGCLSGWSRLRRGRARWPPPDQDGAPLPHRPARGDGAEPPRDGRAGRGVVAFTDREQGASGWCTSTRPTSRCTGFGTLEGRMERRRCGRGTRDCPPSSTRSRDRGRPSSDRRARHRLPRAAFAVNGPWFSATERGRPFGVPLEVSATGEPRPSSWSRVCR